MFHLMESGQIKLTWLVYTDYIPSIFTLMINCLNKWTTDFIYFSCISLMFDFVSVKSFTLWYTEYYSNIHCDLSPFFNRM